MPRLPKAPHTSANSNRDNTPAATNLILFALATGAFCIGTTEFVIIGLLPNVAMDLHVSIPSAGLLVSGYALSVVIGAPAITAVGANLPRKTMLVVLMCVYLAGNLVCAVAGSYWLLMAGRVITALCHGAFFGIASVVAASLVGPTKRASAIAMMFIGLTVANVLGVPLGTALGQQFGWRSTFWAVSVLGCVGLVGVAALVPHQHRDLSRGLRAELVVFARPQLWLALATATLCSAGIFASFTYIASMMTTITGFTADSVTWLLILFGVGLCAGNILGGRAADRKPILSLYLTLALLAAVLTLLALAARSPILAAITIGLFGMTGFATVPPLQMRVMIQAVKAPALASAANIAAFNLGNALGAWLGGVSITAGLGYIAPTWIGAILTTIALAVAFASGILEKKINYRRAQPAPATLDSAVASARAQHRHSDHC